MKRRMVVIRFAPPNCTGAPPHGGHAAAGRYQLFVCPVRWLYGEGIISTNSARRIPFLLIGCQIMPTLPITTCTTFFF